MFKAWQVWQGVDLPLSLLYVDSLDLPYTFPNIKIQATAAADRALVFDEGVTVSFVAESGTIFCPWQGTDFLTAKTGTLTVTARNLPVGLHRSHLWNQQSFDGVYGGGMEGGGRFGDASILYEELPIFFQIQVLPSGLGIVTARATTATQIYLH